MTKMKTLAAIAASTIALSGAAVTAAQAQPWNHGHYSAGADSRLMTPYVDGLAWKIDNARNQGRISWRQAQDLHAQLASVQPLAFRYQSGQARPGEVQRLAAVVNRIDGMTQGYAYNTRRPWR